MTLGQLDPVIRLRALGRSRTLALTLDVDEPATVTVQLLGSRGRVVRQTTVSQGTAGTFTATLSLKNFRPARYTLHIVATDTEGATSNSLDVPVRIRQ